MVLEVQRPRRIAPLSLQSWLNGFKAEINCLVLRKITQDIPIVSISRDDIRIPSGITDPEFMESSKIDMLIGVEIFWDIMCGGQIKATETQPCRQKTHLGWIATGGVVTRPSRAGFTICNLSINEELNHTIKRFWEIDHGAKHLLKNANARSTSNQFLSEIQKGGSLSGSRLNTKKCRSSVNPKT